MPSTEAATKELFVAFAFAAADIVVETNSAGTIAYAAGAFQTTLGQAHDAVLGRALSDLVAPEDREAVSHALHTLPSVGRLLPMTVRLADANKTPRALAGLALPAAQGPPRLCITFSRLPEMLTPLISVEGFGRTVQDLHYKGQTEQIGILELDGDKVEQPVATNAVGSVLQAIAPGATASEIAPNRYGLVGAPNTDLDLNGVAELVERALRARGNATQVHAASVPLQADGLTDAQTVRAIRRALNSYTNDTGKARGGGTAPRLQLAEHIRHATDQARNLRIAVHQRRFHMTYQAIVFLKDRRVHHYEALIRPLSVPGSDFTTPQAFVSAIEEYGLADELDLAVAAVVCAEAQTSSYPVAFNVSSQSVQNAAFRGSLIKLLAASPATKAGRLLVEMTETDALSDLAEATQTLDALRVLDIPFCLDDFGAGAADIRLLRSLSVDIIKLDGSYVAGITQEGRERAFVVGMLEVARAAGVEVIAERVETEEELAALLCLEVPYGQGWLFGQPGPLPAGSMKSH